MKIEKWLGVEFESSCYKTPQFMTFVTDFKKYMRTTLKGKVKDIKFNVRHFYISGFIEKLNGQFVYFSTSDVRHFPDEWYNRILYRSAKNDKDSSGGMNRFTVLNKLSDLVLNSKGRYTTMTPISKAFRDLRKHGYFAEQNFWCCQTCALAAIPDNTPKYVYYHEQDTDCLKKTGKLYLKWRSDTPQEIVEAFEKQGLKVEWNGDHDKTIKIITTVE